MTTPTPWADARSRIEALGFDAAAIEWPNEPFTRPAPPALWLAVEMTGESSAPIELGPQGGWRESGYLGVHIYTPAGQGTHEARTLAEQISDAFRSVATGPVSYHRMRIGDGIAEETDGAYWRLSVEVDYRYTSHVV